MVKTSSKDQWYKILFAASVMVLLYSTFAHIACPLLWNDEAHTVMTAKFTSEFGYPKITDGKNIVYAYKVNLDGSYGRYNEKIQASTLPIWAGYYWTVPPLMIAKNFESIWTKTVILRCWFALTGLIGLLFILKTAFLFLEQRRKQSFLFFFLVFSTLNVSLGLHLREVRYYSLMLLLSGLSMFFFVKLNMSIPGRPWFLRAALGILMALMFFTFHPLYFIFLAAFGLWLTPGLIKPWISSSSKFRVKQLKSVFVKIFPLLLSLALVVPGFGFFRPFEESGMTVPMRKNLEEVISFLLKYDFLAIAVFVKMLSLFLLYVLVKKKLYNIVDYRKMVGTMFFSFLFLVYLGVITRIPENTHLFTRYYLLLFPLMYCSLLFDLYLITDWLKRVSKSGIWTIFLIAGITLCALPFLPLKYEMLKGRFYELTHCYKGPLDYVIPFIGDKYKNETSDLIIATNYEEPAYMYYLNAKTIIGFLGNNLKQDTTLIPDVIVYRKHWTRFEPVFKKFLAEGNYEKVVFPVKDIPINNLPQFDYEISHRFRIPYAETEGEKLELYFLKKEN